MKPFVHLSRICVLGIVLLVTLCYQGELLFARGGGGCVVEGTYIATPQGYLPVELFWQKNETLMTISGESPVIEKYIARADKFFEIEYCGRSINITAEQLVAKNEGEYVPAKKLSVGDSVLFVQNGEKILVSITNIREHQKNVSVYNFLSLRGTYIANGLVLHNKGCFLPETSVVKADGSSIPISHLQPGDQLKAFTSEENIVDVTVQEVTKITVPGYYVIRTQTREIRVTGEHPFYIGNATFRAVQSLKEGDIIYVLEHNSLVPEKVLWITWMDNTTVAYNIHTDNPHTYFANGIAVHNKGGCFRAGVLIDTPQGKKSIEKLQPGDVIVSCNKELAPVKVRRVIVGFNTIVTLRTPTKTVATTPEHPFLRSDGAFVEASALKIGDFVAIDNEGTVVFEPIIEKRGEGEGIVYGIEVDYPHCFIANGFHVHNKGGGSRSSFRSSGRTSAPSRPLTDVEQLIFAILTALWVVGFIKLTYDGIVRARKKENLDYLYPREQIAKKAEKTKKIIEYLGNLYPPWKYETLIETTRTTFVLLQNCWQKREYGPMKPFMMEHLYRQHERQLESMRRNHEINVIENLTIISIDIVLVKHYIRKEQDSFTALIEAEATDYYIDDRTGKKRRGDSKPSRFQEFWTFQLVDNRWLLREIEQTLESNALREKNFVEDLTPVQEEQLYKELGTVKEATFEKPQGTDDAHVEKSSRISRMLQFLSTIDKSWDEDYMKMEAREAFVALLSAFEQRDISHAEPYLMPATAEYYRKVIENDVREGNGIEYRNLCVRKVDLVLVKNKKDNETDEFTARIVAHAQVVKTKNDKVVYKDDYVVPFERYVTFQKQGGRWKLRDFEPEARVKHILAEENVDEESSPDMVKWYYTKDRAL